MHRFLHQLRKVARFIRRRNKVPLPTLMFWAVIGGGLIPAGKPFVYIGLAILFCVVLAMVFPRVTRFLSVFSLPGRHFYGTDVGAYDLYDHGRMLMEKRTTERLKEASDCFAEAIKKKPNFARAHAALADSSNLLALYLELPPKEAITKARSEAHTALEIDGNLAEAHEALAHAEMLDECWLEANAEFLQAIKINPNYPTPYQRLALMQAALGRLDYAETLIQKAKKLDPNSRIISADVGLVYFLQGKLDRALKEYNSTLHMDSNFSLVHFLLGILYEKRGDFSLAIERYGFSNKSSDGCMAAKMALARALWLSGDRNRSQRSLDELLQLAERRFVSPYGIATIYAAMGDSTRFSQWLNKAFKCRSVWLIHFHFKSDFRLDCLRSNGPFRPPTYLEGDCRADRRSAIVKQEMYAA
jgi:tetratricopeptide (TPR) repeat protein